MTLRDGMALYHGSYVPIDVIDLNKCAAGKDFGKGFYLTADKQQARNFIRTSLRKAKSIGAAVQGQSHGFVSSFIYHAPHTPLSVFEFPDANEGWLWFVSLNRRTNLAKQLLPMIDPFLLGADVIIGKIANDTTNPVITTYLNGLYGPLDSDGASRTAIGMLLPNRLKTQYCFLTESAIGCLEPLEVVRYDT